MAETIESLKSKHAALLKEAESLNEKMTTLACGELNDALNAAVAAINSGKIDEYSKDTVSLLKEICSKVGYKLAKGETKSAKPSFASNVKADQIVEWFKNNAKGKSNKKMKADAVDALCKGQSFVVDEWNAAKAKLQSEGKGRGLVCWHK